MPKGLSPEHKKLVDDLTRQANHMVHVLRGELAGTTTACEILKKELERVTNDRDAKVAALQAADMRITSLLADNKDALKKELAETKKRLARKADELTNAQRVADQKMREQREADTRVIGDLAKQVQDYQQALGVSKVG